MAINEYEAKGVKPSISGFEEEFIKSFREGQDFKKEQKLKRFEAETKMKNLKARHKYDEDLLEQDIQGRADAQVLIAAAKEKEAGQKRDDELQKRHRGDFFSAADDFVQALNLLNIYSNKENAAYDPNKTKGIQDFYQKSIDNMERASKLLGWSEAETKKKIEEILPEEAKKQLGLGDVAKFIIEKVSPYKEVVGRPLKQIGREVRTAASGIERRIRHSYGKTIPENILKEK